MTFTNKHFKFIGFFGILSILTLFQSCGNNVTEEINSTESESTINEILTEKSNRFF